MSGMAMDIEGDLRVPFFTPNVDDLSGCTGSRLVGYHSIFFF